MTTWVTVCDTCKREGWDAGTGAPTDGEVLAEAIEALPLPADVKVRRHSCLMGCSGACNVAIQSETPGKLTYTLGQFEPTAEAAEGIVTYAGLHAASETGQVAYRTWPQAIKGHFVTRHPPLPGADD